MHASAEVERGKGRRCPKQPRKGRIWIEVIGRSAGRKRGLEPSRESGNTGMDKLTKENRRAEEGRK